MADRSVTVTLIARIADYERGMAAATAATKKLESELGGLRNRANVDLRAVGTAASSTGHDLSKMYAEAVAAKRGLEKVGDEAKEAGRDMLSLAARIELAKVALHGLSLEFAGSGDRSLTPKIREARRELAELQRVARTITPGVAGAGGGLLSSLGDLGMSLRGSIIPIAIGAAIAATPAISAAVGAAVIGGIGIGGVIGGIALATRDPRVPAAFKPLGAQMLAGLTQDASVFVQPLIAVADDIGKGWEDRIRPHIANMFANLAPSLDNLGAGGIGFLDHLTAGFEAVSEAAGPFLDQFAADLPELGADFERFFRSIAEAGPEITRFFHDLDSGLGTTIAGLGKFIQFGAEVNDMFPPLIVSLGRLTEASGADVKANDAWIRSLFGVTGALMNLKHFTEGNVASDAAATALATARSMAVVNTQLVQQASNAAAAGAANQELTTTFQQAASAANGLKNAFDALNGAELTEREGMRRAEEAVDNFQAALKASHGSLNIHTAAGRAAARAMDTLATSARDAAQDILDNGGSIEKAKGAYDHYIGILRATLRQAGLTKGQIDTLINSIAKMPTHKSVSIKQSGAQGAKAAVDALKRSIDNIHSKTVFVTSIVSSIVSGAKSTSAGHALGTPSAPPGLAWVGERGPELMSFVGGERVFPHQQSMGMARRYAGGTGGGSSGWDGANLTVSFAGAATPFERALEAAMRRMNWNLGGGSTQVAQGRT